jgi:plastocyanin
MLIMRKTGLTLLLAGSITAALFSCSKSESDFDPQGGELPTNYIIINETSFSPAVLTIANGSSVTFSNRATGSRTVLSADSATIVSPLIAPGTGYFVKPDTMSGSQQVYINYHCKEMPGVTGTIILTP